jgi:hypothetical protein
MMAISYWNTRAIGITTTSGTATPKAMNTTSIKIKVETRTNLS